MGSGGGSSEDKNKQTTTTVRYPAYLETAHRSFLNNVHNQVTVIKEDSPYADFSAINIDDAFLTAGYTISSFPALYDMFGKHMAGLDIEEIFDDVFDSIVNTSIIDDIVTSKSDMLDDDIDDRIMAKFAISMRDIDSIESSSFVIGKSIIEQKKIFKISKFESELRYNMFPDMMKVYSDRLTWQKDIIICYGEVIQNYYNIKLGVEKFNYEKLFKDKLWPLNVFEYERSAIGVLTGAGSSSTKSKQDEGGSNIKSALGGAASGAAAGAMTGDSWITAAGGVIGAATSFF